MATDPGSVLIVDDDEAVRNSLKFALELEGLVVRVYAGGAALLADGELPANACLVIDYAMPAMNGLQLLDALRHREVTMPAILIAGDATRDLRERAVHAGVGQVLEKPLSGTALLEGIRAALAAGARATH